MRILLEEWDEGEVPKVLPGHWDPITSEERIVGPVEAACMTEEGECLFWAKMEDQTWKCT